MKKRWNDILTVATVAGFVGLLLFAAGKLFGVDWLFVPAVMALGGWAIVALLNGFVVAGRALHRTK